MTSITEENLLEEMPPLRIVVSGDPLLLTRESILAKLKHDDIRKDLVNLPDI